MKAIIKKRNTADEFYTPERCYITELSNSDDDPGVSIAQARVKPGVATQWHQLKGAAFPPHKMIIDKIPPLRYLF